MSEQNLSRRTVLKGAFLSLAAIPVVVASTQANAGTALPLVYPAKDAAYKAGAICGNCALYQAKATDKQGPCSIFGGKHVLAAGWCKSWIKKA